MFRHGLLHRNHDRSYSCSRNFYTCIQLNCYKIWYRIRDCHQQSFRYQLRLDLFSKLWVWDISDLDRFGG